MINVPKLFKPSVQKPSDVGRDNDAMHKIYNMNADNPRERLDACLYLHRVYDGSLKGLELYDNWWCNFESYEGHSVSKRNWLQIYTHSNLTEGTM